MVNAVAKVFKLLAIGANYMYATQCAMPYPECPANFFFCFRLRVKELFVHFLKLGLEL